MSVLSWMTWSAACALVSAPCAAQAGPWTTTTISTIPTQAFAVAAADLDGDGDQDVAAASLGGGLDWFENRLGNGSVWIRRPIDSAGPLYTVEAADVDGDGDQDLVVGRGLIEGVTWYENVPGDGEPAWVPHTVASEFVTVRSVALVDVDGDDDLDVVSAWENGDAIAWHENLLGDGTSWMTHMIGVGDAAVSVAVADVDGDGDVDVIGAFALDDTCAWFANSGDGSAWVREDIDLAADGAHWVDVADVDGDQDLDVLAVAHNADKVAWYERLAPNGSGWLEHRLPSTGGEFTSVVGGDLDADGDVDVLTAAFDGGDAPPDDPIVWFENLAGDGTQWSEIVVPTNAGKIREAIVVDLDSDLDLDVLFASSLDDTVAWHQNLAFADCNGNGLDDLEDLLSGNSLDLDGDLVPDECASSYCTAKVNSQGCVPYATAAGTPSLTSPLPFNLTNASVLNNKVGFLFYGTQGAVAVPFFGGTLCVAPPLVRTAPMISGGSLVGIDCSGLYRLDFNVALQAGVNPALIAGVAVHVQFWSRDVTHPDGTGVGLSDAIAFEVLP